MQTQNVSPGKSKTASKWLIGCGIGCGVVVLAVIILVVSGYLFFKNVRQDFRETEDMMKVLTERYGKIMEFCPDPDGVIKPERIEAFLAVRSAMEPVREEFQKSVNILSSKDREGRGREGSSPGVFTKIRTGLGIIPLMAEFIKSRNQALLEKGMGIGEYYYVYVVAFYSWLGKSAADGPPFKITGERDRGRGMVWIRRGETEEERLDYIRSRLHSQLLPMLQNQYAKLTEGGAPAKAREKWQKELAAEIKAMEPDRFRLPWQDGLPKTLKDSLEPFRERLEASYSPLLNPIEMSIEQR